VRIDGFTSSLYNVGTAGVAGTTKKMLAYYDPRDTNQDGVVSPAESFNYDLLHPASNLFKPLGDSASNLFAPLKSRSSSFYNPLGQVNPYGPGAGAGSTLDIFA
jgi:hypothetical protein